MLSYISVRQKHNLFQKKKSSPDNYCHFRIYLQEHGSCALHHTLPEAICFFPCWKEPVRISVPWHAIWECQREIWSSERVSMAWPNAFRGCSFPWNRSMDWSHHSFDSWYAFLVSCIGKFLRCCVGWTPGKLVGEPRSQVCYCYWYHPLLYINFYVEHPPTY